MLIRIAVVVALVMVGTAGCGKPPMQEVGGVVLLDGEPVSNCKVGFFPDVEVFNPDRHGYGFGMTHGDGKFTIVHPQGDVGIWAGKYKVTLVAWVTKDGKIETFLGTFSIGQSTVKIMSLNPKCERAIESANGYEWWKTWNGTSLKELRKN